MVLFHLKSLHDIDVDEGTVKLVDDTHQFKDKENTDIVLIPQPSDDPNDPLNWPKHKKALAFISIVFFAYAVTWVLGGIAFGIPLMMVDLDIDLNEAVTGLISWVVLTLGIGNFFWTPTALYIGKRPVFIFVSFLAFAGTIWCAKTNNFHSLIAARVISAFAAAACEGLTVAISADLFFLHERGWWMGLYIIFLQAGASLGSLLSAFIIDALGWRWHFWVLSIVLGVDAVAIFFLFPETQYSRAKVEPRSPSPQGKSDATVDEIPSVESQEVTPSKKSFLQELKPFSTINREENYLVLLLRPIPVILYPATIFTTLALASSLGWFLAALSTNASVFQAPPYNFSPSINGLINIPGLIGNVLGAIWGGALTDKFVEWQARRNGGIFEPEQRLVALILPFFVLPAGILMYGIGVQNLASWPLPFVGFGLMGFGVTAIPSIVMTYLLDAYLPVAYEALLLVNAFKQIFAFGFSYGIVPWVLLDGFRGAFGAMAGIHFAIMLLAVPLWYYGKQIRHKSAAWKLVIH